MNTQPSSPRGFSSLLIILLVAAVIGVAGYYWIQSHNPANPTAQTANSTVATNSKSTSSAPMVTKIDAYFWKDMQNVYYTQETTNDTGTITATTTVPGANAATFVLIGHYSAAENEHTEDRAYYKDSSHVYYFSYRNGMGDQIDTTFLTVSGADPATFSLVNGSSTVDARDKNHTYLEGKVVN